MLWEEGEAAQVEDLVAVLVDKLQNLLDKALGALVLDVALSGGLVREIGSKRTFTNFLPLTSSAQTVSTFTQHCMNPEQALLSSSSP